VAAELGFELADSLFGGGGAGFGLGPRPKSGREVPDLFSRRWVEQGHTVPTGPWVLLDPQPEPYRFQPRAPLLIERPFFVALRAQLVTHERQPAMIGRSPSVISSVSCT